MSNPERRYRGASAESRKTERRTKLLDAGLELLGTVGFEQTTMTAVCASARLTERYFYESFRSRDELLLAVVDRVADEVRDTVLRALKGAEGDAGAKAHAALTAFVNLFTSDPRKGRVGIIESGAAPLRARRHELLRGFALLVVTQARALYGDAALPPPRDEINAMLFVGGLAELLTAWLNGEIAAQPADIIDAATHQFATSMHR